MYKRQEYEYYKPFDDAPEDEEYKEVPTWLKAVAGVAVAAVVGLAVGALVVATGGLAAAALGVTAVSYTHLEKLRPLFPFCI